jgi:hypothetical protein
MPAKTITAILVAILWAPTLKADYSDWYQVEVIVFANQTPVQTDESWPLAPLSYPARMVTIAPENVDTLVPYSIEQLNDIHSYLTMFGAEAERTVDTQTEGFLFESRSRFRVPTEAEPSVEMTPGEVTDGTEATNVVIDYEALFESNEPEAFKALPENQRLLNTQARSIRRSSLYRTLLHQSWLQPVPTDDSEFPVMIQAGKHYDDVFELDGTITVSRSRFLHIETDLWFTEFAPIYQQGQQDSFESTLRANTLSPEIRQQYPEIADWEANRGQYLPVHAHQLQQSRRMRSSTLHFIDHPQFGILVKIERFDWSPAD